MNSSFQLDAARDYWRFAPSGQGKHDTSRLGDLSDNALERLWDEAYASRIQRYPEEDRFLETVANELSGQRILSVGSGLGFHEIEFSKHGAEVTCCDIVPSNLRVIDRIARFKGNLPVRTLLSENSAQQDFGGPYDVVFIYGSLMCMPVEMQSSLLAHARRALVPGGSILLMLYTWDFARDTCGWTDRSQFDNVRFARASDPSVGNEHCPWSDWHDDEKLLGLAGPGMSIVRKQLWQEDWYVWYELRVGDHPFTGGFFAETELASGDACRTFDLMGLETADVEYVAGPAPLHVQSRPGAFNYLLVSPALEGGSISGSPNRILCDVELIRGGMAVGLLNLDTQTFVANATTVRPGRKVVRVSLLELPRKFQIIISNCCLQGPGTTEFDLYSLTLARQPSLLSTVHMHRQ